MSYKKFLKFLFYRLALEILENSRNTENFCGDKKFVATIFFFYFYFFFIIVLESPISHYLYLGNAKTNVAASKWIKNINKSEILHYHYLGGVDSFREWSAW